MGTTQTDFFFFCCNIAVLMGCISPSAFLSTRLNHEEALRHLGPLWLASADASGFYSASQL